MDVRPRTKLIKAVEMLDYVSVSLFPSIFNCLPCVNECKPRPTHFDCVLFMRYEIQM